MAISVQVKEMSLITPSDTTPTHILQLSSLDSQLFLRFTIEYLLLYNPVPGCDRSATTDALKRALSRALVPYYPLTGRVQARPDGAAGLEVDCRAQGAIFVEAVASASQLSDFESGPCFVTERRKFLSLCVTDVLKGAPPLVMQLTWLADGAVALGVGFSHCLCDGVGSAEFLNSFAELARLGDFKCKPVWQRHLLDSTSKSHASCVDSVTHPEFNRVSDLCMFDSRFTQDKLTPTSVTFDRKSINELKKLAKITGQQGESSYTSFEVLSAHIWKAWATSLNLPPNQIIKLLFSINIRKRVEPSLPGGFYGNAIALGCAQTTVKDITKKGLAYPTKLVKQAKEKVGNKYVREVVDLVSHTRACPDSVGVLILSEWSKIGLDQVDFGMGRPVQVGPVCTDRYCLLLPVADRKDSVKVMLAVPSYGADKYKSLLEQPCVR